MKRILVSITVLVCALWLAAGSIASLQTVIASQAPDKNEKGRKLYYQYCASCHGTDAMGNGPAAGSLKAATPSLRNLKGPDGKFPALRVKNVISGDFEVAAHGSREMPVWGRYFREKKGSATANLDIYALVRYLEAFQPK